MVRRRGNRRLNHLAFPRFRVGTPPPPLVPTLPRGNASSDALRPSGFLSRPAAPMGEREAFKTSVPTRKRGNQRQWRNAKRSRPRFPRGSVGTRDAAPMGEREAFKISVPTRKRGNQRPRPQRRNAKRSRPRFPRGSVGTRDAAPMEEREAFKTSVPTRKRGNQRRGPNGGTRSVQDLGSHAEAWEPETAAPTEEREAFKTSVPTRKRGNQRVVVKTSHPDVVDRLIKGRMHPDLSA